MQISTIFPTEDAVPPEYTPSQVHLRRYLVNGETLHWDGPVMDVYSPVMLKAGRGLRRVCLGSYPLLSGSAALKALEAAAGAYDQGRGVWPSMSLRERIRHAGEFLKAMSVLRKELSGFIMWETGKSIRESESEFDRTIAYLTDIVSEAAVFEHRSSRFVIEKGIIAQIRFSPLGVALCMGPFNYPLYESYTTLIPALIAGNTAVFKPPRYGVLLHGSLLDALRESFPPGAVNVIFGDGAVVIPPVMKSGRVDVLSFTGSGKVAESLKSMHPIPGRLRRVLGLEAKNAAVILSDADMELAVRECLTGSLAFNGQRCAAIKIIYIHSSVADEFLERFSAGVDALKTGMPWEEGVHITPLAEEGKPAYLAALVEDAARLGAKVVNSGGGVTNGTFFAPAVLYPVNEGMRVFREEQFGPVVPVVPFDDTDTPVGHVIRSNYGQQISIFGRDPGAIAGLIDTLVNHVSRVNINCKCQRGPDSFPFTARKDSGEGTLSVMEALRSFSTPSLVAVRDNECNREILTRIVRGNLSGYLSTDHIP